jgi:hypothetical protein
MLKIPHCLDNRLTYGGKVVSLTHRPHSTPQKHFLSASGTYFCQRLSKLQGLVRLDGLGKLKKFNYFIRSRTRDLPSCSIVPQPHHSWSNSFMSLSTYTRLVVVLSFPLSKCFFHPQSHSTHNNKQQKENVIRVRASKLYGSSYLPCSPAPLSPLPAAACFS